MEILPCNLKGCHNKVLKFLQHQRIVWCRLTLIYHGIVGENLERSCLKQGKNCILI